LTLTVEGVKVAVVHGLANLQRLVKDIREGKRFYDFVEVMNCPGGCIGGGGMPLAYPNRDFTLRKRVRSL
jgi:NADH-quinone oxidoreductase subunit G